jgi:ribokinase
VRTLRKENISSFAVHENEKGTAYSTIFLTEKGERTVLVYRGASEDVSVSEIPLQHMKTKWVYIAPGGISYPVLLKLVNHFFAKGVHIAINPSKILLHEQKKKIEAIFSKCSLVCVNREEASYATGISFEKRDELFRAFFKMVPRIAIITDGKDGAYVHEKGYVYGASSMKEKRCIDRTGAGDAFCSGFVSALIQKKSILEALRVASANATSVVEHIGAEAGILRKKDLGQPRFQKVKITIKKI